MLRLRDIMTRDVVTMSPELSIRDAMNILSERHIGGAPVVAGDEIVGIVSATDLMELAGSLQEPPRDRPVDAEPGGWEEEQWSEQSEEPSAAFFTQIWAGADDELQDRFDDGDRQELNGLDERTVAEAMTRGPLCELGPDVAVPAAADYMRRAGVHRILVAENGRLLGLVSTMDIARAVADQRLTSQVYVFGSRAGSAPGDWPIREDVPSGELEEDRTDPGWTEVPAGELEDERAAPTAPPDE